MVSLQAALSQIKERPRTCSPITNAAAGDNSSSSSSSLSKKNKKKRKWEDHDQEMLKDQYDHLPRAALPCREYLKLWKEDDDDAGEPVTQQPPAGAIDLHLDTPLPPEWQRCLDIQSGKIHFYNTRTHTRTSRDPREIAGDETPPPAVAPELYAGPVSLDLELNLMCETSSPRSHGSGRDDQEMIIKTHVPAPVFSCDHMAGRPRGGAAVMAPPSWVSMADAHPGEMVAAVCGRCHMLVMMCKSSPSCPNCKFLHAPGQMPPSAAMLKPSAQALVL